MKNTLKPLSASVMSRDNKRIGFESSSLFIFHDQATHTPVSLDHGRIDRPIGRLSPFFQYRSDFTVKRVQLPIFKCIQIHKMSPIFLIKL